MYDVTELAVDQGVRVVAPEIALTPFNFGAFVVAACFNGAGNHAFFATGDGRLWTVDRTNPELPRPLALGAGELLPLALAADCDGTGVLIGTDAGALLRAETSGAVTPLVAEADGWVANLAVHAKAGLRAYSVGRAVHVLDAAGRPVACFEDHPSTPTGLGFSPEGKRLAVAHYNGVTVWDLRGQAGKRELFWRGSHIAVAWSPDGRYIATATQDRDLHCWRLKDERDFRMSGYSSKIRAIAWSRDAAYLCASGADSVTSWHCRGDGPAGKPPLELGYAFNGTVLQVATHPTKDCVAAGYDTGSVLIGDIAKGDAVIARPPDDAPISSLAWSGDGTALLAGTETGSAALMVLRGGALAF